MSRYLSWGDTDVRQWARGPHKATHALSESGMFDDEGLASLLDRMPRSEVHPYVMGDDPERRDTWRRGNLGDADGAALLDVARQHKLWLNVVGIGSHIPEIKNLVDDLYSEINELTGNKERQDLKTTMLISSATSQVFYHADNQPNALWHIRGRKRAYVYPAGEPFITDEALERLVAGHSDEQLAYERSFDDHATVLDLNPGEVAWWPQNRPHRVVNLEGLNVSLSVERRTAWSTHREKRQAANFHTRQAVGRTPFHPDGSGRPVSTAARVIAGVGSRMKHGSSNELEPTFVVDPTAPEGVRSLP